MASFPAAYCHECDTVLRPCGSLPDASDAKEIHEGKTRDYSSRGMHTVTVYMGRKDASNDPEMHLL